MGMKNHEVVPATLIAQIANVRTGGVQKMLMELCKHRLCSYERGPHCKIIIFFFLSSRYGCFFIFGRDFCI